MTSARITGGAAERRARWRRTGRPAGHRTGAVPLSCVRGRLAERGVPLAREQLAECPADLMRGLKRPDDELLVAHEALEGLESAQDDVPLPREACCLESQDACARRRERVVPRAHLMREAIEGNI